MNGSEGGKIKKEIIIRPSILKFAEEIELRIQKRERHGKTWDHNSALRLSEVILDTSNNICNFIPKNPPNDMNVSRRMKRRLIELGIIIITMWNRDDLT